MEYIAEYANEIYDTLGPGYSERVYHNAMEVMLRAHNRPYETERIIPILFKGNTIGHLRADLIIDNDIIVELKATRMLNDSNKVQLMNYRTLTGIKNGILINFPQLARDNVEIIYL
jgi:GxxExxY protein